jgi:hypothetical protein
MCTELVVRQENDLPSGYQQTNILKKLTEPLLIPTLKIIWNFRHFKTNHWPSLMWGGLGIAEKPFREAATGHVHWRTLVAVAERFLGVGCSLLTSLVSANEYSCAVCTWSPNKLWRSNSIFNLWVGRKSTYSLLESRIVWPQTAIFSAEPCSKNAGGSTIVLGIAACK